MLNKDLKLSAEIFTEEIDPVRSRERSSRSTSNGVEQKPTRDSCDSLTIALLHNKM